MDIVLAKRVVKRARRKRDTTPAYTARERREELSCTSASMQISSQKYVEGEGRGPYGGFGFTRTMA